MKFHFKLSALVFGVFVLGASLHLSAQGFSNPILKGFHPDPSICRVGGDYYLVNSSFQYFPGVPISHSRDLVHWETIGYCLNRPSQLQLPHARSWSGIFAPSIRYHNGTFYMITTNCSYKGNFYVTSKNPAGPWSDPIWVDQGGIDPCLFFEGDKAYYVGTTDGAIRLFEIDIQTGKRIGEVHTIWGGTGGRYPEGPKLYKKDGYYYLMIAEGGTEYGHKETIARSRNLTGPYEGDPANPILTHINQNAESSPIQGVGHADLVQAEDGSWWIVCLGFRPQSYNHHLLGRETFLAPVVWEANKWPVVNGNGTISLDMKCATLPTVTFKEPPTRDDFTEEKLGYDWNFLENPVEENYSLTARKGFLRLKASTIPLGGEMSPTFVGRRQQDIRFCATTAMDAGGLKEGAEAGVTVYMEGGYHYDFAVVREGGKYVLRVTYHLSMLRHSEKDVTLKGQNVFLRVNGTNDYYAFEYSEDGKSYQEVGKMDTRFLSSETAAGFTGIYLGMYAYDGKMQNSYADIDFVQLCCTP